MAKLIKGVNDLETYCKQNGREDLLAEWHPTKNGTLLPSAIYAKSGQKVWWYLLYTDENGKTFEFEWESTIVNRVSRDDSCPYLTGHAVWRGFNDLETYCKENDKEHLLEEWHSIKNRELAPSDVTAKSNKKVWWFLPYDDEVTGKHFDFEWEAVIQNRAKGSDCPFLSGNTVWRGFNDFETYCKENGMEYLLEQWHPTRNCLNPYDYTPHSPQKVFWYLPYDDKESGKHFDFEWEARIYHRVLRGNTCPYLSGHAVWKGFNDLETYCKRNDMEYLLAEWHPTRNGTLKPSDLTWGSGQKVWWLLPYDDVNTGKHFDFEWQATIDNRVKGKGCPYLSIPAKEIYVGFNDLETYCKQNGMGHLLEEWHPTKNGKLLPSDILAKSSKRVWWLLPYDDEVTGKHFEFEWQATIANRVQGDGCPYLSGRAAWQGFNDLATTHPEIAKEWHPTRNDDLKPCDVTAGSAAKVWWLFPYDDKETGKHFDFEWEATVASRVQGSGCPYINGQAIWKGFNDLETYCKENDKEYLLQEWHPTKNVNLTPSDVAAGSHKQVWWLLSYDDTETGKHFDFEWESAIVSRTRLDCSCPYLDGHQVYKGFNDFETYCKQNGREDLLREWHPTKNDALKPSAVSKSSGEKVWWYLPYTDENGRVFKFEWQATIASRTSGIGCPYLSGKAVYKDFNDLETYCKENDKEYLLEEWHPTKNGNARPSDFTKGSNAKVWWQLKFYDTVLHKYVTYEWQATIANRTQGQNCPYLSSSKAERLLYAYCKDNKIPFTAEQKFEGTLWIQYYPYDFYLPLHHLIIEADGLQHFQQIEYFHNTDEDFEKRVKTDNLKNKYCLEQNIPILRIPYIYDADVDKDKIIQMVTDFISTRVVPKEILDFYKPFRDSIDSNYFEIATQLNERVLHTTHFNAKETAQCHNT